MCGGSLLDTLLSVQHMCNTVRRCFAKAPDKLLASYLSELKDVKGMCEALRALAVVLWAPLVPCTTSMLEPGDTSSFAAAILVLCKCAQDGCLIMCTWLRTVIYLDAGCSDLN